MKLVTKEETNTFYNDILKHGFVGLGIGTAVGFGLLYYTRKRPVYKTYGGFAKAFTVLAPASIGMVFAAEQRSFAYDREAYKFGDLHPDEIARQKEIAALPTSQRIIYYISQNKYKMIVGAWAASVGGSLWIINRDKIMTQPQKVVQARMYAQALTVVLLLGTLGLTMYEEKHPVNIKSYDYQRDAWKRMIEEEEARLNAAKN
ncbi:Respiratory supercomplex factor 2 [Yarrowia sp. C11]|nr:Respiratory supercomplex factor 2 [Yarrowia sp. C11]KAG5364063.1 Respiratory supercomplex factor 2 [Yarrowia sp. E02]